MTITGRCLCGAIRWESSAPPVVTRVCWCRDCQYVGGGSGTVNACFRTDTFTVIGERINPTGRKKLAAEMAAGEKIIERFPDKCQVHARSPQKSARPAVMSCGNGWFGKPSIGPFGVRTALRTHSRRAVSVVGRQAGR